MIGGMDFMQKVVINQPRLASGLKAGVSSHYTVEHSHRNIPLVMWSCSDVQRTYAVQKWPRSAARSQNNCNIIYELSSLTSSLSTWGFRLFFFSICQVSPVELLDQLKSLTTDPPKPLLEDDTKGSYDCIRRQSRSDHPCGCCSGMEPLMNCIDQSSSHLRDPSVHGNCKMISLYSLLNGWQCASAVKMGLYPALADGDEP